MEEYEFTVRILIQQHSLQIGYNGFRVGKMEFPPINPSGIDANCACKNSNVGSAFQLRQRGTPT